MRWSARHPVAAAVCLQLASPAHAQLAPQRPLPDTPVVPGSESPLRPVREHVLRLVATDSLPSLIVAAYADGRLLWSEAVGKADRQHDRPATLTTPYGLGSLSKSITGTALMQLAERGMIDLDAPVNRYLGDAKVRVLVGNEAELTVRRLLAMRGGIPHYVRNYWLDESPRPPTGDELIRAYGVSVAPPGSRYEYSNLAYGVAERLIERVGGQPYPEYMAQHVFRPLGMKNARVRRDPTDPTVAQAYHDADTALAYWFTDPGGAAALQGSLRDLIRYAHFHLSWPSPISPVVPGRPDDPSFDYALGWGILNVGDGHRILISDGNVFGATSNLQIFPRESAFAILVTNSSAATEIIGSLALQLGRVVAPEAASRRDSLFASDDWPPAPYREETLRGVEEWAGRWKGLVHTPDGGIPVTLEIGDSAVIRVSARGRPAVAAQELVRANGRVEGWVDVPFPLRETTSYRQRARFSLAVHSGRLVGTFTAWPVDDPRAHFVLPFAAELEREGSSQD